MQRREDKDSRVLDDAVCRSVAIVGLAGVGLIHFAQVVPTIEQTPYLGTAFVALSVACVAVAAGLLRAGTRLRWAQLGLVNLTAIGGYAFTRLFSTPFDNADVGNWSEMLGVAALFLEALLVLLSAYALASARYPARNEPARRGPVESIIRYRDLLREPAS